MKKILSLHGFTSSGSCDTALALRKALAGEAKVLALDLLLYPEEAVALIEREIRIIARNWLSAPAVADFMQGCSSVRIGRSF